MIKQYLRYFRWVFIAVGVLALIYGGILVFHSTSGGDERTNTECLTEERVFDYGDVLTDKEEEKLRKLIAKRERQTECDIVLVTLNESLKEYARDLEPNVSYEEFVRVYAEDFYDSKGFGYNNPIGDGVILVDNWFREDDGKIYTWLCTTGTVKEKYSWELTDHLLDRVYLYVEDNPYRAYKTYINDFYHDMTGTGAFTISINNGLMLALTIVITGIFVTSHWISKKGKKTTLATTYVNGGKPHINKKEDTFINKVVTKRHIQRNSSGGGGGSSSGGGGGSHGGGGHSR